MNRAQRRHYSPAERQMHDATTLRAFDTYITIGMYMCEAVLANEFGWGKIRLEHLENSVHELCRNEFIAGAAKFSDARRSNLGHGITRMADRLEQLHGPGHCDWLREWLKSTGVG